MNLDRHYVLDENHKPVAVDLMTWGEWFEKADRRVALTNTKLFRISTVFLGLDHQFGKGPPLIFETMSFERQPHMMRWMDGTLRESFADEEQVRYSTWDDAMDGHNAMVRRYLKREEQAAETIRNLDQLTEDMQKVAKALSAVIPDQDDDG